MTVMLEVEDGRARDFANTYADMACADAYLVPRGLWPAAEDSAKERALIRAFDWLNSLEWLGTPLGWEQQAAWPRENVPIPGATDKFIASDVIPRAVIQAQLEVAAMIYNGIDMFTPKERGGKVVSESHSRSEGNIDVIGGDSQSDSYTYSEAAPTETYYPAVASLLNPFLAKVPGTGGGARMVEGVGRG